MEIHELQSPPTMRYLKLVLVLVLITFCGFQSNTLVANNVSINTTIAISPNSVIDMVIHGRTMRITNIQTEDILVTVEYSNGIIYQNILTVNEEGVLSDLPIGEYIIKASNISNTDTQTETVIIE